MTKAQMISVFHNHHDAEHLNQKTAKGVLRQRPDLAALIALDELVPGADDLIARSEPHMLVFSIDPSRLAAVVTEEDIVRLLRLGIFYDDDTDSLALAI